MIKKVGKVRLRTFDTKSFERINPKLELWHKKMKSDILNCYFFIIAKYSDVGYCSADVVLSKGRWLLKLTMPYGTPSYDTVICGALIDENTGEQLHATVFICDKKTATVAWYDPYGVCTFVKALDGRAILARFSEAIRFRFRRFLPPAAHNSLQVIYPTSNYRDVNGYCLYWTFAILDFYLLNRNGRTVTLANIGSELRAAIDRNDPDETMVSRVKRLHYIREYMMYAWKRNDRFVRLLDSLVYKDVNDTAFLRGLYMRDLRFLNFGRRVGYIRSAARISKRMDDVVAIATKSTARWRIKPEVYSFLTTKTATAKLVFFLLSIGAKRRGDYDCELTKRPWRISLFDSRTVTRIAKKNKQ